MNKTTATRILNAGRNAGVDVDYDDIRQAVHFYGGSLDSEDIKNIVEEYNGPIDDLVFTDICRGTDHHVIVSQVNRGIL